MRALLVAITATLALSACVGERPRVLGDQCDLHSDCSVPLVCGLGRCHNSCASTRDCPLGSSCAATQGDFGVCLLPDETSCLVDSDCPESLVCRSESCVNACEEDRDCPAGSVCTEVDSRRSCEAVADLRCALSSDCPEGLVCGRDGRCRLECIQDRDCRSGERCDEGSCRIADPPGVDAGADAGPSDAGPSDAGQLDSGMTDSGGVDAGPDAGPPAFECADVSECSSSSAGDGASYTCQGGRCLVTGCGAGRGDCDFAADNGCEASLDSDTNCGGCGFTCGGPGGSCVAGVCAAIVQLTAGNAHQCYRQEGGAVLCWGENDDGQLGDGMPTTTEITLPVAVVGLDAVDVSAGRRHTCAIERSGQVVCWGYNSRGQLGDGTLMTRLAPTPCVGLPDPAADPAVSVSAGSEHSCAVFASGALYCWGRQSSSRLGNGVNTSTGLSTPVQVNGAHSFTAVATADASSCGLRADGEVLCWGSRSEGQLGDGSTSGIRGSPSALVQLLDDATSVANGSSSASRHSCALRSNGVLSCWGAGRGLGYGGTVARPYAVTPDGMTSVRAFGVGANDSCAVTAVGDLYCWGSGVPLPQLVALPDVTHVAVTNEIHAVAGGRIYSFSPGGTPTLVEGF